MQQRPRLQLYEERTHANLYLIIGEGVSRLTRLPCVCLWFDDADDDDSKRLLASSVLRFRENLEFEYEIVTGVVSLTSSSTTSRFALSTEG